jgi:hypothetical protein
MRRTARVGAAILFLGTCLLLWESPPRQALAQKAGYTPVASGKALARPMLASLKALEDWLDQKDYASTKQTLGELAALVPLSAGLGSEARWRELHDSLRKQLAALGGDVQGKRGAEARKKLEEAVRIVEAIARTDPGKPSAAGYRPTGGVKTWMVLLDAAYSDAKTAKTPAEAELLAQALAEESNAVALLRGDARWAQTSREVRDLALQAAAKARSDGLEAARSELKKINARCEFCHQGFKR